MLSNRVLKLSDSATMQMAAEVIRLKEQGGNIINFGVGEPDFNTSENIKQAAVNAIHNNKTRYTLSGGMIELRQAVCDRLQKDYGLEYQADEVIITNGAKQGIYNALMALINPGDEVIIPVPYWPSHPEVVHLAGGTPVFMPSGEENNFKIKPDELLQTITTKTKALLFSNPNNPTGMVYDPDELKQLLSVLKNRSVFILCDEVYAKLLYDDVSFASVGSFGSAFDNRIIIFQAVSKAYAMTGWRIGFAAGPKKIITAMEKIQSHSTSNPSSISQYAALEALSGNQSHIRDMVEIYSKRRDYVFKRLEQINMPYKKPNGAFYVYPKIEAWYKITPDGQHIKDSADLSMYLLKEAYVSIVPGSGFGLDGYMRISYSTSMKNLEKGFDKISEALYRLE